jgi:hypothetical protein
MPRKVELCERALGMVEREDNPVLWGRYKANWPMRSQQNPLGNRAENLEKAIHHYQQALEVSIPARRNRSGRAGEESGASDFPLPRRWK